jgi:cytochrome c-type biogenesis protein CcmH
MIKGFLLFLLCFHYVYGQDSLEDIYRHIKCPQCQGQSIYDSEAPIAYELRSYVAQAYGQGRSKEAIFSDLRARYGESVLFEPPYGPYTWVLWWAPILFLGAGAVYGLVRGGGPIRRHL